jgi:RNA polymerase sigma-70 factor (ECF subfamily)
VVSVLTHQEVRKRNGVDWDWLDVSRFCLRVATRILGPGSTAEDAAQEAAIVAWRNRTDCRSPEAPWPWIAVIARREALRQCAGASPVALEEDAVAVAPEESQTVLRLDVRHALADLSEHERALVLARYWNDLTQEQVAAALQIPAGTVKIRLHRLRERLRPILQEP